MSRFRLKSRTTGALSAPILFYLPEGSVSLHGWYARKERYAHRPESRFHLSRTGQLFHFFVDDGYVASFLSPAISDTFKDDTREPHIAAALARLEA
jgi:hypothetical protein